MKNLKIPCTLHQLATLLIILYYSLCLREYDPPVLTIPFIYLQLVSWLDSVLLRHNVAPCERSKNKSVGYDVEVNKILEYVFPNTNWF